MDLKQGINKYFLKDTVEVIIEKVPLISSMVFGVDLIGQLNNIPKLYIISIKIIAVLVILYCFTYQNNSNYLCLMIAFYLYLASAKVNAITFLNHLSLLISYNVL